MDRYLTANRSSLVWTIGMFVLAVLCLSISACSATPQTPPTSSSTQVPQVTQATPTHTPTPTRLISAVELTPTAVATATPSPAEWQGTIHSATTGGYGSAGTCTGETWDMQFQVQVAGDGSVTGKGSGQIGSNPTCSGPGFLHPDYSHQATSLEFSVRGNLSDQIFKLQLTETKIDGSTLGLINYALVVSTTNDQPVLTVPITAPGTATGQTNVVRDVPYSNGGTATAQHKVTMTCTSCK